MLHVATAGSRAIGAAFCTFANCGAVSCRGTALRASGGDNSSNFGVRDGCAKGDGKASGHSQLHSCQPAVRLAALSYGTRS